MRTLAALTPHGIGKAGVWRQDFGQSVSAKGLTYEERVARKRSRDPGPGPGPGPGPDGDYAARRAFIDLMRRVSISTTRLSLVLAAWTFCSSASRRRKQVWSEAALSVPERSAIR
jgi:hypothetical protein